LLRSRFNHARLDKDLCPNQIIKVDIHKYQSSHEKLNITKFLQNSEMDSKNTDENSVEALMDRVRESIAQYDSANPPFANLEIKNETYSENSTYEINELLTLHDEEFLTNAFRKILKRDPDPFGQKYLDDLRAGDVSKTEILCHLRYSSEGKQRAVQINNLPGYRFYLVSKAFKIPVLGRFLQIVRNVVNTPNIIRNLRSTEIQLYQLDKQNKELIKDLRSQLDKQNKELIKDLRSHTENINTALNQEIQHQSQIHNENLANISKQLQDQKYSILNQQQQQTTLFSEIRTTFEHKSNQELLNAVLKEEEHILDDLYVSFEDRFRGSRSQIKDRQVTYLPLINEISSQNPNNIVLDIGCGRGEWIELLSENDIAAEGVDMNKIMLETCKEAGLTAHGADAVEYLKSLSSNTIAAITAFHFVEHVPLNYLLDFFDECLRVLKPGGAVIFETPNPENIMTGACNFYIDPTHLNPIPPQTLQFLTEYRGFSDVSIKRLHPIESEELKDPFLKKAFFGAQDYSVIGYKEND
jgi:2-polyprenyl-3-methyl-5-hydroxy-6-metoxy-1,4-benzoquinol methylase